VDLFVEHPVPFEGLWTRSEVIPLTTTSVRVAAIAGTSSVADEKDDRGLERDWGVSWEAQRLHQLTLGLAATPARLAWLEEMIALAHRTGALPRRAGRHADRAERVARRSD
jgi:hypothetical protein